MIEAENVKFIERIEEVISQNTSDIQKSRTEKGNK